MKKYVKISSTIDVRIAPDLRSINMTNLSSPIGDKLNVKPAWPSFAIVVKKGVHYYPAEITNWDAVKVYAENNYFTIEAPTDVVPAEYASEAEALYNKLHAAITKYEADKKLVEKINASQKEASDTVELKTEYNGL